MGLAIPGMFVGVSLEGAWDCDYDADKDDSDGEDGDDYDDGCHGDDVQDDGDRGSHSRDSAAHGQCATHVAPSLPRLKEIIEFH